MTDEEGQRPAVAGQARDPDAAEAYVRNMLEAYPARQGPWFGPDGRTLTYREWVDWVAAEARADWSVAVTVVPGRRGAEPAEIRTSFLPNLAVLAPASERPVLWETMVFGGGPLLDLTQWRWPTREMALTGHRCVVLVVRAALTSQARRAHAVRVRRAVAQRNRRAARRARRAAALRQGRTR